MKTKGYRVCQLEYKPFPLTTALCSTTKQFVKYMCKLKTVSMSLFITRLSLRRAAVRYSPLLTSKWRYYPYSCPEDACYKFHTTRWTLQSSPLVQPMFAIIHSSRADRCSYPDTASRRCLLFFRPPIQMCRHSVPSSNRCVTIQFLLQKIYVTNQPPHSADVRYYLAPSSCICV